MINSFRSNNCTTKKSQKHVWDPTKPGDLWVGKSWCQSGLGNDDLNLFSFVNKKYMFQGIQTCKLEIWNKHLVIFLAATKQLYEWFSLSVCPSQLSGSRTVTPVWIHIWWWYDTQSLMILKRDAILFFKVIRQISRVTRPKKSWFLTQIRCFRTVDPVCIHQCLRNDAQSLKRCPNVLQGHLSNFKVTRDKKNHWFWPTLGVSGCNSSLNSLLAMKWCTKLEAHRRGALLFFKVMHQISRSHGTKYADFDPKWVLPDYNSSLNSPMNFKWYTKLDVV